VKVWTRKAQLDLHPLVLPFIIAVHPEIDIGRLDTGVKEGQLYQLLLDEADEGLIGLEVDGLDLDLHEGKPLKSET
jgi:uncharacterized protein (UPF0264 family)